MKKMFEEIYYKNKGSKIGSKEAVLYKKEFIIKTDLTPKMLNSIYNNLITGKLNKNIVENKEVNFYKDTDFIKDNKENIKELIQIAKNVYKDYPATVSNLNKLKIFILDNF